MSEARCVLRLPRGRRTTTTHPPVGNDSTIACAPSPPGRLPSILFALAVASCPLPAGAGGTLPPGAWEVTVEVGMPHLEENLRYATTRETRCLTGRTLASLFPALRHESLAGCRLDGERTDGDELHFVLVCDGAQETAGAARWQLGPGLAIGTLDVRMGGKNMTFYERVTARAAGPCEDGAK